MDAEKSSNSSFEDLSNLNLNDSYTNNPSEPSEESEHFSNEGEGEGEGDDASQGPSDEEKDNVVCDILGNGQLTKRVLTAGTPHKRPSRGDLVTIQFTGKLASGKIVEKEDKLQLHIGDFEVVQGLDMAIPLMNVGEVAEVVIEDRFAYGDLGLKNDKDPEMNIPPNAQLTYHVSLLDVKTEDFADVRAYEIRKKYGTQKKERANFWYNRNEFTIAIQLYRRALEYLDDRDGDPDAHFDHEDLELSNAEVQSLLDDRLVVYNNLAMAQIKISAFEAALKSVEHVLLCQPKNSKALYRKGRILEGKGDTRGAISMLQKAAELEPESKIIQQDLSKLFIKARREEHNEKKMYQKMMGQAKKLEQKNEQQPKQQSADNSKLKLLGYIMGSILIGVAGVAFYRYKY